MSEKAGWICFGSSCSVSECGGSVPASNRPYDVPYAAVVPSPYATGSLARNVHGWAKVCEQGDSGWISLNCSDPLPSVCGAYPYRVPFDMSTRQFTDTSAQGSPNNGTSFAWNGDSDGSGIGYVDFHLAYVQAAGESLPSAKTVFDLQYRQYQHYGIVFKSRIQTELSRDRSRIFRHQTCRALNEKGRARLVTYAFVDGNMQSNDKPLIEDTDRTAALLKKMVAKARCTTKRTVAALPVSSVFSSIISVPAANEKELKEAIQWQAKKLIPVPLEDITLDSKTIDTSDAPGGKKITRVLITGAPKPLVNKYIEIFKKAGLDLISLETEAFAQIRSLVGKDRSSIMVIDIGSQRTNISVVEKGVPFLNRSIATGGIAISQTIAKTLGITFDQANTMKRDIRSMQGFTPTGDLSSILQTLLKPILDEIRYSFNLYQGQSEGGQTKRIDKIILTGVLRYCRVCLNF